MATYDWNKLEKEYILGDYKTVSAFLKDKGIKNNGNTKNKTKGWKEKRVLKQEEKSTKTIEKVLEKEAEKEATQIVDLKSIANDLALNIIKANTQLEQYIVKNKKKTKKVVYDYKCNKPSKEMTTEKEEIEIVEGIIDRKGLKELTSALRDINEILGEDQKETEIEDTSETDADIYGS